MSAPKRTAPIVRETELYAPLHDYLCAQGYTVRSEVKDCDITATLDDELVVIELKRGFSTTLLIQATQRQRVTDSVYVALPEPPGWKRNMRWRRIQHLLRRLELGLIWVSFASTPPQVQIVFHPLPFERKHHARGRRAILKEIAGRSGEYNQGGSTRNKLVTAYRENALVIACQLDQQGALSPRQLRALGTGPKTQDILAHNYYGWFERVARGVYALSAAGRVALEAYPELLARLRAPRDET
jgi:hypothetical protein